MVDSTVRLARLAQDGDDIAFSYRREQEVADEVVEEAGAAGRRWTSDEEVRCTRRGSRRASPRWRTRPGWRPTAAGRGS